MATSELLPTGGSPEPQPQGGSDALGRSTPLAVVRLGATVVDLAPGAVVTVGRGSEADVECLDPRVSRVHLTVRCYGDGRLEVEDAGTTNGTYCYGRRVTREEVCATTDLSLGSLDGPTVTILMTDHTGAPSEAITGQEGVPLTVGRSADNSIVLEDPLVSRHHARLVRRGECYEVSDLSSRNGVQVNGAPVTTTLMAPGDRLSIGRTTFQTFDGALVPASDEDAVLSVEGIGFTLPTGKVLLDDVTLAVPASSLLGVIGPSGAGKSTLLRALTGTAPATRGRVMYGGSDLYRHQASLRQRIGVVPQDDVVHRQLTVRQALDYAAELRLPSDYTSQAREAEVDRVLGDLGLDEHAGTPISRLSGGQRKRTSVAMELLTQPNLLILDEPTSGLDPNLDRSVMGLLRQQADSGRIVIVVTHSVANLDMCDNVLVLAPGGRVAYFGRPGRLLGHFRVRDYADVFRVTDEDPEGAAAAFSATRRLGQPPQDHADQVGEDRAPDLPVVPQRTLRQFSTLVRRQARIVLADRSYALSTVVMPLVLALMALAIPGSTGFRRPATDALGEPSQLLVILVVGAAFMGMSASVRELVGERAIFLRERAVGLSPAIYLAAKFCVLLVLTLVQSLLLLCVVLLRKPPPHAASLLGNGTLELLLAICGTALASAAVGLMLSAIVGTNEQAMPVLVVSVMGQLVMCGGLITVTGRPVMEALAALVPARWGYAQGASTIDLRSLNPTLPQDGLWAHTPTAWLLGAACLTLITSVSLAVAVLRLHRQKSSI